jgi:uncharacterized protein with GYD domain
MAKYLFTVKYTPEGVKSAKGDGYATRQGINERNFEALGGRVEQWFWTAGGDWDLVGIAELPPGALATIKTIVDGAGAFARTSIVEIFDSSTMDAAAATTTPYRAPGQ